MGRRPCCDRQGLKKGPWSAEEDEKLASFLLANGGSCSWRAVPELAGLLRCGKSCRLRWTNYLRPDLKRGLLSPAEEQLVIDLHARMGNKWSKIAAMLPGRTDNEIKNIWNTHLKKKLIKMGIDPVNHEPLNISPSRSQSSASTTTAATADSRSDEQLQAQSGNEEAQQIQFLETDTSAVAEAISSGAWEDDTALLDELLLELPSNHGSRESGAGAAGEAPCGELASWEEWLLDYNDVLADLL